MKLKEKIIRAIPIAIRLLRERISAHVAYRMADKTTGKNVFRRKGYTKRVLMVSLPAAFKKNLPKYHTSLYEAFEVAKIFDSLGYIVDFTTDNNTTINLKPYDVIYGGRKVMAEAWRQNIPAKTLSFSPGAHPFFCFEATVQKNLRVREREGRWLTTSSRYLNEPLLGLAYYVDNFADHVIVYGNQYVLDNYLKYDTRKERYSLLPAFYFDCHQPDIANKDFEGTRHSMCWFGSLGLIHKGLDIAIDIALAHPEIELHICGASIREREFWNYYNPLIQGHTNIINHGFVNIESDEFVEIMSHCAFVVHPSISEGGAASVLNVVANAGLIPICSKSCGLDLPKDGSVVIDEVTYEAFEDAILEAMKLPVDKLQEMAICANKYVREHYTLDNYRANMSKILHNCVNN